MGLYLFPHLNIKQGGLLELNKENILQIFSKNFSFSMVETVVGKAIKMPPIEAFLFSNVTGAGYLDDPCYPFSPKGTTKILREAFQYNFVTGIFDKHNLYYSPSELKDSKPYLFNGDKYILLCECNSEKEFRSETEKIYNMLTENKLSPTDFIVFRIEGWKNGNGMECFLEYLACEFFKKRGYIVENQIPLMHTIGTPDFGGYKNSGGIGFHPIELALLRITGNYAITGNLNIENIIVGEAKTATTIMASQLEKYLKTGLFCKGYEMHPDKPYPTKNCFGLFNINNNFEIILKEPEQIYKEREEILDYSQYINWFINYLKLYILSNFKNAELANFINQIEPKGKYNQGKIIKVATELSIKEIINTIKECD